MNHDLVILKPVITEKSISATQKNCYTFKVILRATKKEIQDAVTDLFKVDVLSVKTIIFKGKTRKSGKKRLVKKLPDQKKAIVEIKEGQKIALFETGGAK